MTVYEGDTILNDAYDCQKNTHEIRVRPLVRNDDELDSDEFTEKLKSGSRYFLIEYTTKHKGLSWLLRLSPKSPRFITFDSCKDDDHPCSIKARINPKLFAGIKDYLSAESAENLEGVEEHFNLEASKISPLLGCFNDYEFNRVDYCVNFSLRELGIDYDPLLIVELFQRSNIPNHFHRPLKSYKDRLLPFNEETTRFASLPADEPDRNTFVLTSDSININCYYKYNQEMILPIVPTLEMLPTLSALKCSASTTKPTIFQRNSEAKMASLIFFQRCCPTILLPVSSIHTLKKLSGGEIITQWSKQ